MVPGYSMVRLSIFGHYRYREKSAPTPRPAEGMPVFVLRLPRGHASLDRGAVLKGSTDLKDYMLRRQRVGLLFTQDCRHVSISGFGTIDGDPNRRLRSEFDAQLRIQQSDDHKFKPRHRTVRAGCRLHRQCSLQQPELQLFSHDIPGFYAQHVRNLRIEDFDLVWAEQWFPYCTHRLELTQFDHFTLSSFTGTAAPGSRSSFPVFVHNGKNCDVRNTAAQVVRKDVR